MKAYASRTLYLLLGLVKLVNIDLTSIRVIGMGRRLNQRDFPERRKTPWRTIFVGIILLTIPLYIIGLGLWLFAPSPNAPTPTPTNEPFATFTPLGQGGATPNVTAPSLDSDLGNTFLTLVATEVNVTGAPVLTVVVTNPPIIQPTDAFQPVTIVPPSQVPTFFITNTPHTTTKRHAYACSNQYA
jgi:hypothetical protein